jgi:hypothetical protein
MYSNAELLEVKQLLDASYPGVQQLGSDRAVFLLISQRNRAANISIADEGWFVELWEADKEHVGEDICVREFIVEDRDEALTHIRNWLEGACE